jgi:predicted ArsR family transcriptional regulator
MNVEEIAQKLKLQPITIRHHLQSLIQAGFIEPTEERASSVGRPKIFYKMVREPPLLSYPKRGYLFLSNYLINTLRSTLPESKANEVLRKAGFEMGKATAKRLESEHEIKDWSIKAYEQFYVRDYLEQMGAEPEVIEANNKKLVYRLHNCLFFELSVKMPEIMCDILHENFHEGLVKAMGNEMKLTRSSCLSKGDPYCEHSCRLVGEKSSSRTAAE